MTIPITVTINDRAYERSVEPRLLLVHFLRDVAGLTGTKIGCDTSQCGACTVLLDGVAVKSCTCLAVQANGAAISTIEGLANSGELEAMQNAFWSKHGLQCGFCTPGMLMTGYALLKGAKDPGEDEVRRAISGNLCRCTGYVNIVKAVQHAAAKLR